MTKKEFQNFASLRKVYAKYSGKKGKFYLKKTGLKMDIHYIINQKNKRYEKH